MVELPWSSAAVELAEVPALQLGLRLRPPHPAYLAGMPLPLAPNEVAARGGLRVLWLGPDEWLVTAPPGMAAELPVRLARAIVLRPAALHDLSASRIVIAVHGAAARRLLEAGCGLDLHPRSFGPGRCAQTLLARVPVILDQLDETPHYRVLVRRSYARWLAAWLIDAAQGLA